jgi:hypothetical protein
VTLVVDASFVVAALVGSQSPSPITSTATMNETEKTGE